MQRASPQVLSELTASGFSGSGKATHLLLGSWEALFLKTCCSATILAPKATSEGGTRLPSPSHLTKKKGFGKGKLCHSPPSFSNLPVGQYKLCPQPESCLESVLLFPPLFLVSNEVPLTPCSSNPQHPRPTTPHPRDLSTLGHRHGITTDHGRGSSAISAKVGCPLHNQGKKTCMEGG